MNVDDFFAWAPWIRCCLTTAIYPIDTPIRSRPIRTPSPESNHRLITILTERIRSVDEFSWNHRRWTTEMPTKISTGDARATVLRTSTDALFGRYVPSRLSDHATNALGTAPTGGVLMDSLDFELDLMGTDKNGQRSSHPSHIQALSNHQSAVSWTQPTSTYLNLYVCA